MEEMNSGGTKERRSMANRRSLEKDVDSSNTSRQHELVRTLLNRGKSWAR